MAEDTEKSSGVAVQESIVTSNMNLIAAILTVVPGSSMNRRTLDRSDPKHIRIIVTGDAEGLKKTEEKWFAGELTGNLRDFATFLKDVKSLIHEGGCNGDERR